MFAPLSAQTRHLLDGIPTLIDKAFPLPGRFRSALPSDVAELSRLLTSGRGERGLSYLGRPNLLSAYLRYFLPWNLYRLCRLLPGLNIALAANDRITDLGCGPLTFAAALYICRPDLRSVPLEFYCIDRSGPALDAGKKFFAALVGESAPWKIHTVKGDINAAKPKPAALVCAVNVFNEMYGDISRNGAEVLRRNAEKAARLLATHASASSAILAVEPGFPRCGEFISLLRGVFLQRGRRPASPCPHDADCPFPGGGDGAKKRWCHFAFDTDDAPAALHRLSHAARLPKERAVLSFLFTAPADAPAADTTANLRVISDAFPLPPTRFGRYCCSREGLILLAGARTAIEKTASGALVSAVIKEERDPKSGAFFAEDLTQRR
jgi:ribosomal protein RSM22 (predicted rRNA methylase)